MPTNDAGSERGNGDGGWGSIVFEGGFDEVMGSGYGSAS